MACYYHVRKGALKRGHRGDNDDEEEEEQTDIDGEIQELFDGTRSTHRQRERESVCVCEEREGGRESERERRWAGTLSLRLRCVWSRCTVANGLR
jgi:hypothetical protein